MFSIPDPEINYDDNNCGGELRRVKQDFRSETAFGPRKTHES
jgi:hypothetical protein